MDFLVYNTRAVGSVYTNILRADLHSHLPTSMSLLSSCILSDFNEKQRNELVLPTEKVMKTVPNKDWNSMVGPASNGQELWVNLASEKI